MYAAAMFLGALFVLGAFFGATNSEWEAVRAAALIAIACFVAGFVFLIDERTRRPPPPPPPNG
jgi:hypothetical protein